MLFYLNLSSNLKAEINLAASNLRSSNQSEEVNRKNSSQDVSKINRHPQGENIMFDM